MRIQDLASLVSLRKSINCKLYSALFIGFTSIHSFLSYPNDTCKELECIKSKDAKNVVYTIRVSIIHVTTATVKGTGNVVCCSF